MKTTIIAVAFTFFSVISYSQKVYYVQDKAYNANASDMNPGTDINYPWATWQKAFNTALAGDTVYFRGGVWAPASKVGQGYPITIIDPLGGNGHNGTHDKPVCFFAYPPDYEAGNFPILDCRYASTASTGNVGISIEQGATNIKFKGLTVRHVRMLNATHNCVGIGATSFETLYFENMTVHNIGGAGMWAREYDTVYFKNCDVYNCCDSLDVTTPGGDGDGFVASSRGDADDTTYMTVITGCRSWHNSDDGFDVGSTKQLKISDCWSWNNGVMGGDGTGFKFSYSRIIGDGKRWVRNCITAYNICKKVSPAGGGYTDVNLYSEDYGPRMQFYNNVSYNDFLGFMSGPNSSECGVDPSHVIYRNNMVYITTHPSGYINTFGACNYQYPLYITQDHNTWLQGGYSNAFINPAYTINNDDFVSLDTAQLRYPRKPDGTLPDITFLKPKIGSDLVDAGIDVGLPYNGLAPDIGRERDTLNYPSVVITSPADKSVITNYNTVITAAVSNAPASKVEFFCDETDYIGEATSYPFSIKWDDAPLGNHTLRAVASTSDPNVKATSLRINVTIIPGGIQTISGNVLFPNPNNGSFVLFLATPLQRNGSVTIISIDGKVIFEEPMPAELMLKEFNLHYSSPGTYILILSTSEIIYTQKFIME